MVTVGNGRKSTYRIADSSAERLGQILANTLDMDATHSTDSQSTNQGVLVSSIL